MSQLKVDANKNRPPSEMEIKTLIFGKKDDDSFENEDKKQVETQKVLQILESDEEDNSGSGSGKESGEASQDSDQEQKQQQEQAQVAEEQQETHSQKRARKKQQKKEEKRQRLMELLELNDGEDDFNIGNIDNTQKSKTETNKTNTVTVTVINGQQKFTKQDRLSAIEKLDQIDMNDKYNQKFMPIQDFKGIVEERGCTNIFCLLVWIILNGGFFFCAVVSFMQGQPNRLSNGNDFRGDICGVGILQDRQFQYFAAATIDLKVSICVTKCPQTTGQSICLYNLQGIIYPDEWQNFCYQQLACDNLGRYCMPKEPLNRQAVEAYLSTTRNTVKRLSSDLNLTLDLICIGAFLGVLLAFGFQYILRYEQKVPYLIWGCIWGSVFCFCIISYLFYQEYVRLIKFNCLLGIDKHSCGGSRAYLFYTLFWVMLIVAGVYLLIVINLFNRINLAIGFVKASSRVINVLNQLTIVPFFSVLFQVAAGALTILACIYAMTIGQVVLVPTVSSAIENNEAKVIEYSSYSVYLIIFLFYMFYNWQLFAHNVNNMITSFALCIWFFAKKKDTVQIPLNITLKRIFRYHIGTVSLYVLMKPIFIIPKMLLDLVIAIFRQLPQGSQFVRYIEGCFCFCINIYSSFLRYISVNCFVQTCLFGDGYGTASKKAYFLINRHKEKLKDLDFLISFMIYQIKLCCALIIAVLLYIIIRTTSYTPILQNDLSEVETPILPAGVIFIICYQISDIFQGSFHMACKTIIQCYFVDKEMFVGEQRFVEKFIRDFMEFYAKEDLNTFKIKSQKAAAITQKLKNKEILQAINKNYFNEFEGKTKPFEKKKQDDEDENKSDDEEDKSKNKESDSDSYVIEGDDSNSDDQQDDFNIGGNTTKPIQTQPIRIQQRKNTAGYNTSNMYINDNASSANGETVALKKMDETSMRSSGVSFFDSKTKNNSERLINNPTVFSINNAPTQQRLGTGNSETRVIDLSRGGTANNGRLNSGTRLFMGNKLPKNQQ
ncbi:hypothetical protein ABPG74_022694 [Tetrahymena malaccensis]